MNDKEFLTWIYNRLKNVHNENPLYDYMIRLDLIIDQMSDDKRTIYKDETCIRLNKPSDELPPPPPPFPLRKSKGFL